ncbi:MAG: response regulator [Candidatus Nitricoxidivorans perseverans]|uniref:Response regulator n=1 Tax=Candidatus Nitricoxidivorans perseverans TaxID=2975601 RepID=A0AA49FNF0_9PROT|nr:MAG: response regulator [Candidatus Nitricoxidivorans perseverans]
MTEPTSLLPRILIVDDSRIVRATIIKHIRDRFDVREEADGEAGWEALLVDPTIQLVISDMSMPRLDGYGLLERVRNSGIARIRETPVIMISGDEDEESRQRAKDLGASDFIAKGIGTAELLARLGTLVALVRTHEALEETRAQVAIDPATGVLTRIALLRQTEQALSFAQRHGGEVSAVLIGFDRIDELAAAEGGPVAEMLVAQFSRLLAGTVRREDLLGRWTERELAIASPGITEVQARAFAERLRLAVARADIRHQGRPLTATLSIGVASSPADTAAGAEALMTVAEARMVKARGEGGDRVAGGGDRGAAAFAGEGIDQALARVALGEGAMLRPHLARLGLRLLPLLRLIDDEFHFGLPLADLEKRLSRHAKTV